MEPFSPDAIHLATEGPLGLAVRAHCLRQGRPFTTSYPTRFPEYVRLRAPIPLDGSYAFLRWFHQPAACTMVATRSMQEALRQRGFDRLATWSRGVDTAAFRPHPKHFLSDERPISMYVGRVAVEKNVRDFLDLALPGTKYVVGDGPAMAELQRR